MSGFNKTPHSGQLIASRTIAYSPSDINNVPSTLRVIGFMVNTDGNVSLVTVKNLTTGEEDPAVTVAVKAGIPYPISVVRINSTNTTVTGVVLLG